MPALISLPRVAFAAVLLLAGAGCKNECQKICTDMADYAADSCGQEFSKDEIKACVKANKRSALAEGVEDVCEETRPFLTEEWTCDDIAEYFDTPAAAGDGADGGGDETGTAR